MLRRELFATLAASLAQGSLAPAEQLLSAATAAGQPRAAVLAVQEGRFRYLRSFGAAQPNSRFLIASITKPMTAAALLWLRDRGRLNLSDSASRFLPEFTAAGRDRITIRHLLTHTSGLPDMLPENTALRRRQAPLSEYVRLAFNTPLLFPAGAQWSYSSTGILLAATIAERLDGRPLPQLLAQEIFRPLGMKRTVLGLGKLRLTDVVRSQTEFAPADLGATPDASQWDWNSPYWRGLASPWGGAHSTATDIANFLDAFLHPRSGLPLRPETLTEMTRNHNPASLLPFGLGFSLGARLGKTLPENSFGHGGSTGTLCWADPAKNRLFVLLTSLPANVANAKVIHPVSGAVAAL